MNEGKRKEEARIADEAIKRMMSHGYIDIALELSAYIDDRRARGVPSTGTVRRISLPPVTKDFTNVKAMKGLRKWRGWTQKKLAKELGIPLNTVKGLETDKWTFIDKRATEIAEKLGMTLEEFQTYAD